MLRQIRMEMAFNPIIEAVNVDPLSAPFQHSFDVIDPATPRFCELLSAAGDADVPCHIAMARYHAHAGRTAEALTLLDAVTLLAPVSRGAWMQKAAVHCAAGNAEEAMRCEAEAAAISTATIPFDIPDPAGERC